MADHPHTIDRWDDATGENLIEQIAAVGDYLVALAAYQAAVQLRPNDKITPGLVVLRQSFVRRSHSWTTLNPAALRDDERTIAMTK